MTVTRPSGVDAATSKRLSRVRQKNTTPELLVRRLLHHLGIRFRVGGRGLPGRPDITNRTGGWAVLVHGCFWHRHPGCGRATAPKRNATFWMAKFKANQARDARVVRELRALGLVPVVVWECEVENRPATVARRLQAAVSRAGSGRGRALRGGGSSGRS